MQGGLFYMHVGELGVLSDHLVWWFFWGGVYAYPHLVVSVE